MRLRSSLGAIAAGLLVAACGGSPHPSSVATATVATTSSARAPASSSSQSAAPAATTTTSSTSAPPEVPKTRTERRRRASPAASQGAHVVVRMVVAASGDLSPPSVAVPSGVGVELHLTNHGHSARTVVLDVPGRPTVRLRPAADGGLQAAGQRDGTYPILVDGTARGQLMSGAQGGP